VIQLGAACLSVTETLTERPNIVFMHTALVGQFSRTAQSAVLSTLRAALACSFELRSGAREPTFLQSFSAMEPLCYACARLGNSL
jgi:hypothetical protein